MSQDLIEKSPIPDPPKAFTDMAARIARNEPGDFCGAFVIVPPTGDHAELLLLNNQKNPSVFWSLLKTTAEIALTEIEEAERQGYRR